MSRSHDQQPQPIQHSSHTPDQQDQPAEANEANETGEVDMEPEFAFEQAVFWGELD